MRITAHFFSWVLHPLMIVSYATVLYFFLLPSDFSERSNRLPLLVISMIFTGTALLPATMALMMARLGKIGNLQMEEQKERNWPLLFTALVYFSCYYVITLRRLPIPAFVLLFLLGAGLSMVVGLVINLRWKISLHMIGVGGLCGGFSGLFLAGQDANMLLLAASFLFAGILGTSRLVLNAHSPAQVAAGFTAGFVAEMSVMAILLR